MKSQMLDHACNLLCALVNYNMTMNLIMKSM